MQRTILCYGDSNTWGYVPQHFTGRNFILSRYSRDKRWPGILQKILGKNYQVIEEGLNGRTTNLDYHIPPDRNGKNYLAPCLYTHAPIDIVVLALGANDFKAYFNRKAEDIKNGLAELINIIQSSNYGADMQNAPKILIIPPAIPLPIAEQFQDENGIAVFNGAIDKAKKLIELYSKLAEEKNCYFLDVSNYISPSEIDGIHLDENNHEKLANLVTDKIKM
ncbi:MAG: SGNH/GDSL hydrolase family protein [Gammaproteobacteria bacterium]|nr:SGNH/GDSL hydrolase family protein [Gammaproteobacteria bacterium]